MPASYTGDDGRVWHCIQIAKVSPTQWSARYGDLVLGQWRDVGHCAARALLDLGIAKRDDMMRTFHGSAPSMRGSIGWWADHSVSEPDRGRLRIVKWRPFDRAEDLAEAA